MTPQQAITTLDRFLEANGETITLRRVVGSSTQTNVDVTVRAAVGGYQPKELVGSILQGDSRVIMSSSEITAASWPVGSAGYSATYPGDQRVPLKNDRVIVSNKTMMVIAANPISIHGELVRIELQVRG